MLTLTPSLCYRQLFQIQNSCKSSPASLTHSLGPGIEGFPTSPQATMQAAQKAEPCVSMQVKIPPVIRCSLRPLG